MHKEILQVLVDNGFEAYFVGGAVRDTLLGLPVKDWDIATAALPSEIMGLFGNSAKMIDAAQAYPVVIVEGFEVASLRNDTPGASRQNAGAITLGATIEQDAIRRDISINSLYMDVNGNIIDPTQNGLNDIQNKLIRLNGDPYQRLNEDPLRSLRCVRFAARFGFSLHPDTKVALANFRLTFK